MAWHLGLGGAIPGAKPSNSLIKKMRYEPSRFLTDEQMKLVEKAIDYNGDADFTDMRERMIRATRFNRQHEQPTVKFYLNKSQGRFNAHWIAPSQVVHGSLLDTLAAWNLSMEDGELSATGELDSLEPLPNGGSLDSCEFEVHAALLMAKNSESPSHLGGQRFCRA